MTEGGASSVKTTPQNEAEHLTDTAKTRLNVVQAVAMARADGQDLAANGTGRGEGRPAAHGAGRGDGQLAAHGTGNSHGQNGRAGTQLHVAQIVSMAGADGQGSDTHGSGSSNGQSRRPKLSCIWHHA